MLDQANDLRKLVSHYAAPAQTPGVRRPEMIVVAGGKGGVGTTTMALRLAAALGVRRLRTVVVDAARGGNAATLCGIEPRHSLAEVLSGHCTLAEAIQPGPGGLQILPGTWGWDGCEDAGAAGVERLLAQLAALGPATEMVVVDAGNHPNRLARWCWRAADQRLAVTTPETAAIMATYALIKRLAQPSAAGPIHLLVNGASGSRAAQAAYSRLARACYRLLAVEVNLVGHVKKNKKGLNYNPVPADMKGELSAVDTLLNYAVYMKFNGDRGTQLWHERTPASSAPWHS
jgi:flagellar biosynthesis protein FlhG